MPAHYRSPAKSVRCPINGARWNPERLEAELKSAAGQARRHLETAAHATGIRRSFEVAPRRPGAERHRHLRRQRHCRGVAVAPDRHGKHARVPPACGRPRANPLPRSAFAAECARKGGPIVAVAAMPSIPASKLRDWIAIEAHERLLVLAPAGTVIESEPNIRFLPGSSDRDVVAALGDIRNG